MLAIAIGMATQGWGHTHAISSALDSTTQILRDTTDVFVETEKLKLNMEVLQSNYNILLAKVGKMETNESDAKQYLDGLINQRKRYHTKTAEFLYELYSLNVNYLSSLADISTTNERNNLRSLTNNLTGINFEQEIEKLATEHILKKDRKLEKKSDKFIAIIKSLISNDGLPTGAVIESVPILNSVLSFMAAITLNSSKVREDDFNNFKAGIKDYFEYFRAMDEEFAKFNTNLLNLSSRANNLQLFIRSYGYELTRNLYAGDPATLKKLESASSSFLNLRNDYYSESKINALINACNCDNDILSARNRFGLNETILINNVNYIKNEFIAIMNEFETVKTQRDIGLKNILERSNLRHSHPGGFENQILALDQAIREVERIENKQEMTAVNMARINSAYSQVFH